MTAEQIVERLKADLRKRAISQEVAAKASGYTRIAMNKILGGKWPMRLDTAVKICEVLGYELVIK